MAAQKDKTKKATEKVKSGGKMGAGRSGKEDMGGEKPSDGPGMGSHKAGGAGSRKKKS